MKDQSREERQPENPIDGGPWNFIGGLVEKIFDFIKTFFPKMSKRMQAIVFLTFVIYFIVLTSIFVWRILYPPHVVQSEPLEPIYITGSIRATDGSIPISLGLTDVIGGDYFFVRKQFTGKSGFVYN